MIISLNLAFREINSAEEFFGKKYTVSNTFGVGFI